MKNLLVVFLLSLSVPGYSYFDGPIKPKPIRFIPHSEIRPYEKKDEKNGRQTYQKVFEKQGKAESVVAIKLPDEKTLNEWLGFWLNIVSPQQLVLKELRERRSQKLTSVDEVKPTVVEQAGYVDDGKFRYGILQIVQDASLTYEGGRKDDVKLPIVFILEVDPSLKPTRVLSSYIGLDSNGESRGIYKINCVTRIGDSKNLSIVIDAEAYAGAAQIILAPEMQFEFKESQIHSDGWD
jgi:hypothetical protein